MGFLKVVGTGNITKTAQILHYTQAGVSHAVAALERETGFALFLRTNSGVELTENGKRLVPSIRALVGEQRKVTQAIHDINHVVSGTIRIGTFTSVSVNWLPVIMQKFMERYPDTDFDPVAGDYDEITARIRSGELDCGFLTAPCDRDLFFQTLCYDPMLAVLPAGHPLGKKAAVPLEDIQKEPFIMPMKGSDQDILAVTGRSAGKVDVRYTLNDDFSVISLAAHGFGVTIMPELILRCFKTGALIRPLDPPQYRKVGIAALPLARVSFLTGTFIRFLCDAGEIDLSAL